MNEKGEGIKWNKWMSECADGVVIKDDEETFRLLLSLDSFRFFIIHVSTNWLIHSGTINLVNKNKSDFFSNLDQL